MYLGALGPRVDGAWYCICLTLPEMTFSRLRVGEEVEAYLGPSGPRADGARYCICLSMLYACLSIKFRNTSMYICIFCGQLVCLYFPFTLICNFVLNGLL